MNEEDKDDSEIILQANSQVDNESSNEGVARLNQRLQYYQSYLQGNSPDNMYSSEDEGPHPDRGSKEAKGLDDEAFDNEFEDLHSLENQYAPLDEGGLTLVEEEEFGDFMEVSTASDALNRIDEIDSILAINNLEELEKNDFFGKLIGEDRRYTQGINSFNNSNSVEVINEDQQDANDILLEENIEIVEISAASSNLPVQENLFRSIPPLPKERVQRIKEIMANIKIKPPSNIGTIALLDSFERQHFRLGDECSTQSEK